MFFLFSKLYLTYKIASIIYLKANIIRHLYGKNVYTHVFFNKTKIMLAKLGHKFDCK